MCFQQRSLISDRIIEVINVISDDIPIFAAHLQFDE
jgi:hypothetical protein